MFVLHVVSELSRVTNEDHSELLVSITLANAGQKGGEPCLSNKWKCKKKNDTRVVCDSLVTSAFDS